MNYLAINIEKLHTSNIDREMDNLVDDIEVAIPAENQRIVFKKLLDYTVEISEIIGQGGRFKDYDSHNILALCDVINAERCTELFRGYDEEMVSSPMKGTHSNQITSKINSQIEQFVRFMIGSARFMMKETRLTGSNQVAAIGKFFNRCSSYRFRDESIINTGAWNLGRSFYIAYYNTVNYPHRLETKELSSYNIPPPIADEGYIESIYDPDPSRMGIIIPSESIAVKFGFGKNEDISPETIPDKSQFKKFEYLTKWNLFTRLKKPHTPPETNVIHRNTENVTNMNDGYSSSGTSPRSDRSNSRLSEQSTLSAQDFSLIMNKLDNISTTNSSNEMLLGALNKIHELGNVVNKLTSVVEELSNKTLANNNNNQTSSVIATREVVAKSDKKVSVNIIIDDDDDDNREFLINIKTVSKKKRLQFTDSDYDRMALFIQRNFIITGKKSHHYQSSRLYRMYEYWEKSLGYTNHVSESLMPYILETMNIRKDRNSMYRYYWGIEVKAESAYLLNI